ncbi:hypothetical protein RJ639_014147 [Escallonia herrerae]|uniref:Apyrase n=1 Tax=Escallonia herrerae TaxID=1293975 RepID=A0AA88VHI8_9ASTE|nr:hypothetical protein RJ639_014147 [Escallonia herrerae]
MSFQVTINYLLGHLGKKYSNTVGVVDLGGGSVQMAYAISEMDAAKAPRISDGEDSYVREMYLKGTKYFLYVHSYLNYGLLAARAEILIWQSMHLGSSSGYITFFPAGFLDPNLPYAKVGPIGFSDAAKRACETRLEDAKAIYPRVEQDNLPYLCMDLVYQFTLLVDGFALDPWQEITLVKKVQYQNSLVEAAWPLGSAIEVASSS